MKMKKLVSLLLSAAMVLSLAACGGSSASNTASEAPAESTAAEAPAEEDAAPAEEEAPAEEAAADIAGATLEVAVTYTNDQLATFKGLVDKFTAETGVNVNVAEYGDDYEATLKTRMAANEMPDIWQTHGWSILRYKEYLMDLSDQPWVADLDDSALGVIKDSDGSIYVLMISELINATLVNLDVCDAAGVDPYAIHTYDDLTAACEKIKAAGYTPFGVTSNPGLMANYAGTFVTYAGEIAEDGAAQLDGTWDWASYKDTLIKTTADWITKGYFYDDILTMDNNALTERFADNKSAFILGNDPGVLITCTTLNPDGRYAFIPSFASQEGGVEHVAIGEGDTFGIWKDTKNEAAAKAFLEFFAQAEIANEMNQATGKVAATKSCQAIDDGQGMAYFAEMKEKCADCDIFYDNFWDRKYMPSGMWPILGNASNMLFEDPSDAGQDAVMEYMKENYVDLYEAAHAE